MASSKHVIEREVWERTLNRVRITKQDMDKLVMDFLVTEGYAETAEKFQVETGTEPNINLPTVKFRMIVKRDVLCKESELAVEKLNELDPEILDTNPRLFFRLSLLTLIELVRDGRNEDATEFLHSQIDPIVEDYEDLLEELQAALPRLYAGRAIRPVSESWYRTERLKIASELNEALLNIENHEKGPMLDNTLQGLMWAQEKLAEKVDYPRINSLWSVGLEDPAA